MVFRSSLFCTPSKTAGSSLNHHLAKELCCGAKSPSGSGLGLPLKQDKRKVVTPGHGQQKQVKSLPKSKVILQLNVKCLLVC